jgi:hypothetical protein
MTALAGVVVQRAPRVATPERERCEDARARDVPSI